MPVRVVPDVGAELGSAVAVRDGDAGVGGGAPPPRSGPQAASVRSAAATRGSARPHLLRRPTRSSLRAVRRTSTRRTADGPPGRSMQATRGTSLPPVSTTEARSSRLRILHEKFVVEERYVRPRDRRNLYLLASASIAVGGILFAVILTGVLTHTGLALLDRPVENWFTSQRN